MSSRESTRRSGLPSADAVVDRRAELESEWHPTSNGDLLLSDVTDCSARRPWWRCAEGHVWQTRLLTRLRGSGCPYCSGRSVVREASLAALHPEVVDELHPTRNPSVDPWTIAPGSNKRLWWRCSKGHEFQAPVVSRVRYRACRTCAGYRASETNNLAVTHPAVAAEWHPTSNGDLRPQDVVAGSGKRVWWLCGSCGHSWLTRPQLRTTRGKTGCPECAREKARGRALSSENLTETHPDVAAQWHPIKNGNARPDGVTAGSNSRVWWSCAAGHSWQAVIKNRAINQNGCPMCSGRWPTPHRNLAITHPAVAAEWDYDYNDRNPENFTPRSGKRVWWTCSTGHTWEAAISHRTNASRGGSGCPACAGKVATPDRNLATEDPALAAQWHPTKNPGLDPENLTPAGHVLVWWLCVCGEEFQRTPNGRRSPLDRHRLHLSTTD